MDKFRISGIEVIWSECGDNSYEKEFSEVWTASSLHEADDLFIEDCVKNNRSIVSFEIAFNK